MTWSFQTPASDRGLVPLQCLVFAITFSKDGQWAQAAPLVRGFCAGRQDAGVMQPKIWDLKIGKELFSLEGHRGLIFNVAFSPDGNGFFPPTAIRLRCCAIQSHS